MEPNAGQWWPHGGHALCPIGHEGQAEMAISAPSVSLTTPNHTLLTPKPRQLGKNSINKSCRATCKLQLCLNELGLIRASFQIVKLQSKAHETVNQF